jgi:hypothetical protein
LPDRRSRFHASFNLAVKMNSNDDTLSMIDHLTESQLDRMRDAAENLLECYVDLSSAGTHLLVEMLDGSLPCQWAHYPDDDVIDRASGYQFFYHSHSPDDRGLSIEHGHIHVFARMDVHGNAIEMNKEDDFLRLLNGEQPVEAGTISLLCVSLDAKGVPNTLFTVNRWVTGDHLFSAATTQKLIPGFLVQVEQYPVINKWLEALLTLFWPQIEKLLIERDRTLLGLAADRIDRGLLEDESVEILSSVSIDIDRQIKWLLNAARVAN